MQLDRADPRRVLTSTKASTTPSKAIRSISPWRVRTLRSTIAKPRRSRWPAARRSPRRPRTCRGSVGRRSAGSWGDGSWGSLVPMPSKHPQRLGWKAWIRIGAVQVFGYGVRLSEQEYTVRAARSTEASAILDLWRGARSAPASTLDRPEDVHRLLAEMPGSLLVADAGWLRGRDRFGVLGVGWLPTGSPDRPARAQPQLTDGAPPAARLRQSADNHAKSCRTLLPVTLARATCPRSSRTADSGCWVRIRTSARTPNRP